MADNADLSKNPYDVLGISPGGPDVTDAEIKKVRMCLGGWQLTPGLFLVCRATG